MLEASRGVALACSGWDLCVVVFVVVFVWELEELVAKGAHGRCFVASNIGARACTCSVLIAEWEEGSVHSRWAEAP